MNEQIQPFIPLHTTFRKKVSDTVRLWRRQKEIQERLARYCGAHTKSPREVLQDMLRIVWRHEIAIKYFFDEYFEEHIHAVGHELEQYVTWYEWLRLNSVLEKGAGEMATILNDKNSSWQYLRERGIAVTKRIGSSFWENGRAMCRLSDGNVRELKKLLPVIGGVFMKPADLCQGQGCAKIQYTEIQEGCLLNDCFCEWNSLEALFYKGPLVMEELVRSHPALAAFHPQSLNTVRMVTMRTSDGNLEVNRSLLRMGVGAATIDSWCAGGLAVRIKPDGMLVDAAVFEDLGKGICYRHPDTGIPFAGFEVPFYREAVALVLEAHRHCPQMFGVGWDVAITGDGPLIVEGNVQYALFQPICGGLRPIMESRLRPAALAVMNRQSHP